MSYHAIIHDLRTGRFLLHCSVDGHDLREAESAALNKAAFTMSAIPSDLDVRHLHQCAQPPMHMTAGLN